MCSGHVHWERGVACVQLHWCEQVYTATLVRAAVCRYTARPLGRGRHALGMPDYSSCSSQHAASSQQHTTHAAPPPLGWLRQQGKQPAEQQAGSQQPSHTQTSSAASHLPHWATPSTTSASAAGAPAAARPRPPAGYLLATLHTRPPACMQ